MKKSLFNYLSAILIIFAAGCSNLEDVDPNADQIALEELENAFDENLEVEESENLRIQKLTGKGLRNLRVSGELEDGGNFVGMISITSFSYDEEEGLLANGEIIGIARTQDGKRTQLKQTFTEVATTLANENTIASNARIAAECQILFLDLGPIFLDVLGLQVDLSQIILDVTAVSGAGNLLGNLLCAVAGLLDPISGLLAFLENLGELLDLISQINEILGRF